MPALDTVTATATFSNNALVAMAAATGDTLQIRSIPAGKGGKLLTCWAQLAASGIVRLTSPRFHDNTRGLQFRVNTGESKPLLNLPSFQKIYDQDQLAASVQCADAAGNIESLVMLMYYEQLDGVNARLLATADVMKRAVEQVTVEDTITTGAGGGYTGARAINAASDLLKANTDYALLGACLQSNCAAITLKGADTGNLRVAVPGDQLGRDYTKDWFWNLSDYFGLPLIPVFNSANRGNITQEAVQNQGAAAVQVSWNFVELA